jgi:hypothetical protein
MMKREYLRSAIGFVPVLIGALVFIISDTPWNTPSASTVFYSVLAFLTITIAVSAVSRIRIDPTSANKAFAAGTIYASIIFAGASILYILTTEPLAAHSSPAGVALNLVALATTGAFMLLFTYLSRRSLKDDSLWNKRATYPFATALGVVIFGFIMVLTRLQIDELVFLVLGYVSGVISIVFYGVAAVAALKRMPQPTGHDNLRLAVSFLLLAAASVVDILVLPSPSSIWLWSIALMGMAFIFAVIATSYPYLKEIGIQDQVAYLVSVLISVIVILPFVVTALVEAVFFFDVVIEYGTTVIIHTGGAIWAGSLAYTLFMRARIRSAPHHQSIILLLEMWSVVEATLVVTYIAPLFGVETAPMVPYIVGLSASVIFLTRAAGRTLLPTQEQEYPSRRYHLTVILFFILLAVGLSLARLLLSSAFPLMINRTSDMVVLLALSYFALSALITFIMVLTASSGGDLAFSGICAGFVSAWLVISVLKVNFSTWTAGWWVAEVLLAIGLALFPPIMVWLYLRGAEENVDLRRRADVYSQYISSRITRRHQTAMDSLERLSRKPDVSEKTLEAVSRALTELSSADEMTESLGAVLSADRFSEETLEHLDLVKSVLIAYDRLKARHPEVPVDVTVNKETGECAVLANSLLVDMFYNLMLGIVGRIGGVQSIDVEIEGSDDECSGFEITMQLGVSTEEPELRRELLFRYLKGHDQSAIEFVYARRLLELFGGDMAWDAVADKPEHLTVHLTLFLPGTYGET